MGEEKTGNQRARMLHDKPALNRFTAYQNFHFFLLYFLNRDLSYAQERKRFMVVIYV